ncbi:MAG: L-aspartate oxidase [Balneolaceae bacterium]
MSIETIKTDFLIAGSGIAGLNAAYHASRFGSVVLITKETLETSSSYQAQGGVAAVLKAPDSFRNHIHDTLEAGRNYCNPEAVDLLVKEGARQVQNLIDLGMDFDKTDSKFELGLEGGHSKRRILHANGAETGKALVSFLNGLIRENPAIKVIEHAFLYNLAVDESANICQGADVFLYRENNRIKIESNTTILATGGYSGLYSRTTNPHTSTGDGLWLAYQQGAILKDLEFIQFHPTALFSETGSAFLISEALRGEGARLYNSRGERFMLAYPQKELAPRDVVAKEIFRQIQNSKLNYVYLDVRHLNVSFLRQKYPALIAEIEDCGLDIEKDGIPVAPAAHYCIGGLETNLNGQTAVHGLYACGEVAAVGVHGANRLASNSLLECLVFSYKAVEHAGRKSAGQHSRIPSKHLKVEKKNQLLFEQLKSKTADILNTFAGIEREASGLKKARRQINGLKKSVKKPGENEYYTIRMNGMLKIAEHIILSALKRQESRGVHSRIDFPQPDKDKSKPFRFAQHPSGNVKKNAG